MTLGLLAAGWVRRWEARVYVLLGAVSVVAIVGFSRLYLGAHYLSDVVAGYLLGAFWATVAVTAGVVLYRGLNPLPASGGGEAPARAHDPASITEDAPASTAGSDTGGGGAGGAGAGSTGGHHHHGHADHKVFSAERAKAVLDDERRLLVLSEEVLRGMLSLEGTEDIVDVGSGTGFYTNRVAAWTTGRVYAVELQEPMQQMHRDNGVPANVELIRADADQLPLSAGSVDRALSINAFHESHGEEGLRRLAQALRPHGLFVIIDWRKDSDALEHGPPSGFRLATEDVIQIISPWFEPISEQQIDPSFAAVVARKK
jgi:hypothetical protein